MTFAPAIASALRAVPDGDPARWFAERFATPYDARPVSSYFADAETLLRALDTGDTEALGAVVAMAAAHEATRCTALTMAVLAEPSLHHNERLVLMCVRHHATHDAPEVLRAALPFLTRRWLAAQTGLNRSPCAQRAELLATHLDEAEVFMAPASLAWPTDDAPEVPWPPLGDDPPVVGRLVMDVWTDAAPTTRERLRAFCERYYARAASQRARYDAASALLYLGDPSASEELSRSMIPMLRTSGLRILLEHAPFETIARNGARFFSPGAVADELRAALHRCPHVAVCPSADGEHAAVAVTRLQHGPACGLTEGLTRVGWLHIPTGAWIRTWEATLALYAGARMSLSPPGEVVLLQGYTRNGALRRYFFVDAEGTSASAGSKKEMKSLCTRKRTNTRKP